MFCNKCGAQLPEQSVFCNKCGASQTGAPPAVGTTAPLSMPAPPLPPDAPEEIIWKGRYSAKAAGHWWILWGLWVAALAYLYLAYVKEKTAVINYVALGAAALPALVIFWDIAVRKLSLRYRLSTHRFFKESGILSRHVNEIELIRVDDVSVRQNIVQRIFDVGTVTIISTDATEPRCELEGIDNPIEVKERIRTHVRERRKRALHMESL